MSSIVYNASKGAYGDWTAGAASAYKWMLVSSAYTPNADHATVSAITAGATEITGGSYARQDIAGRTKTVNNSTDKYEHSATNPTFTGLSAASPRYMIGYKVVSTDADHVPVVCIDIGTFTSFTGDLTVKIDGGASNGVAWDVG